jgi:NAD(P)-dependent dehydrogenase (short-subunit alcohol dehydrogenase family)
VSYPYEVSPTEFKDKRVLVTGGTAGVGLATVQRFALAGAKVLTTAREINDQLPREVIFVKSDLTTPEGTKLIAK